MPYSKTSGIYQIWSRSKSERAYVGCAINIKDRWGRHLRALRKNKHENIKLQRHFNKYGEDDLVFEIIESGEYLDKNHLLSREQMWMIRLRYKDTWKPFFNIEEIAGSPLGITRSEETKRKVGLASKGRNLGVKREPMSDYTKNLLREQHLGMRASKEARAKMSISHKRENLSNETLEKMRVNGKNQVQSEEEKRKRYLTLYRLKRNKSIGILLSLLLNGSRE